MNPVDARLEVAPAFSVGIASYPGHEWGPELRIDVSTGNLVRRDADGTSTTLQRVTTVALLVGVSHPVPAGLRASVAVGGLKYLPGEDTGIFREGGGAIAPLGTVGIAYGLPLGGVPRRWWLEARYDVHGFTTQALHDEGFTSSQIVHRVTLSARVEFQVAK